MTDAVEQMDCQVDEKSEAPTSEEAPEKILAQEEQKLKQKYPTAVRPGGSLFLQKKLLQRGQKYFDSGDYNMARGQAAKGPQPKLKGKTIGGERLVIPDEPTGGSHPSPDVIPHRKASVASKLVSGSPTTMGIPGITDGSSHPLMMVHPLAGVTHSAPLPSTTLN